MTYTKQEIEELEKLVEEPLFSCVEKPLKRRSTKKHARKLAEPHLRAHKSKGRDYYYYVRGTDKEIYLGDADAILEKVKGWLPKKGRG